MSAQEILAEISKLSPEERREVRDGMGNPNELVSSSLAGSVEAGEVSENEENIPVGLRGFKRSKATTLKELAEAQGIKPEPLVDVLARFAGTFDGLPEDMAVNHDHYLYGSPKQKP